MKIDYDKKNPFTSVKLIKEENEFLSEEQTQEFRKIGLRCVRISYFCIFFSIFAFVCEFVDLYNILNASKIEKILAKIGYVGFACLIISLVILFVEARKLNKINQESVRGIDCE